MAVSFATVTPSNMELTPCQVSWKGPADSVFTDLGGTLGNVSVKMKFDKAEIKADQFGKSVLDRRVSGVSATVEFEIAEVQNKDLWKIIFPHANKQTVTGQTIVDFTSMMGDSDLALAGQLKLHPLSKAATDENSDLYAWKACATAESDYIFSPEGQTKMKLVFNIYLDTTTSPARLLRYGDKDVVAVY